jgi:hypothetical protein
MITLRSAVVLAILTALRPSASAGFCSAAPTPPEPRHNFQFFAGYSPASVTVIGAETGRRLALAGFDYSYRCWNWKPVSLSFTSGVMPAAILIQPGGHAVYGVGVTPIGLTLDLTRHRKLHPFVEFAGGIIASTEPIPERQPDATGLNFLFGLGGGVQWKSGERSAVSVGYKFLHISNAFTTDFNPGLDNNVFYVGFSILR